MKKTLSHKYKGNLLPLQEYYIKEIKIKQYINYYFHKNFTSNN